RAAGVRYPQALGQKQLQLVAEALPPVAQVRALVWELVLEELFPGEVLEIRIVDPALAHAFIGQPVYVFEQQQPDRKARLDPGPALLAIERCDLSVDPVPVDRICELCQLVLEVDDLIEPRPEQIARSRGLVLLRPHRSSLRSNQPERENHDFRFEGILKMRLQGSEASNAKTLQSRTRPCAKQ